MPKALLGYSGGKLPGISRQQRVRKERRRRGWAKGLERGDDVTWEAASVSHCSNAETGGCFWRIQVWRQSEGFAGGDPSGRMSQGWGCSQVEDVLEEGDAMDWLEDDETLRHWEEVSNEEQKITLKRREGDKLKPKECKMHRS